MSIREQYQQHGVDDYYRREGADYENPHFPQVRELLLRNRRRIDCRRTLDLCCGSGEVSLVLREFGCEAAAACDPYTGEAYRRRLGRDCLPLSFDDIIRGRLNGEFTSIIASFALHLCPPKQLFPLVYQLLQHTPQLVVITPHKRPALEELDGVRLDFTDAVLTERGKQVKLKSYSWRQG